MSVKPSLLLSNLSKLKLLTKFPPHIIDFPISAVSLSATAFLQCYDTQELVHLSCSDGLLPKLKLETSN